MNTSACTALLKQEVKGLTSYLVSADYKNAQAAASRDTGWALPVTDSFQIQWYLNRSKRWLIYYLWTESAAKFQVEQIHLEHKFKHYGSVLEQMDQAFVDIQDARPDMFAGVDSFHLFGTKVDAGFSYGSLTGRDETYLEANKVDFGPNENT
ncbi:MAG: hypothetical protein DRQ42_00230 [Gammaproteobacteria bacterium]|nr:MAG: hypothetical protein DRQ42_00230 [Gammaproteobacteria bacterium]